MGAAKSISMTVRPLQSADLCFPISGIIESQLENILGLEVNAFDREALQAKLQPKVALPTPADLDKLPIFGGPKPPQIGHGIAGVPLEGPACDGPYDISLSLKAVALSRLRADDIATQLTQILAWYGLKYTADQGDDAIARRVALLGKNTNDPNSVLTLLNKLSDVLRTRYDKLKTQYGLDPTNPWTESSEDSETTGNASGPGNFTSNSTSKTTYLGREMELPWTDNRAKWLRSEISSRQERLAAYRLVKLNIPENVLRDKAMTAAEIRKIQLNFIDTFLVAPFSGVVTAVYKNVGDFVAVGEPVIRLENDRTVYLVGVVKCREMIRVGYKATVKTTLFGEAAVPRAEVEGTVCAVRGHEPNDEQWNIIIRCNNVGPSGRVFPLNYNFDFDETEIQIDPV